MSLAVHVHQDGLVQHLNVQVVLLLKVARDGDVLDGQGGRLLALHFLFDVLVVDVDNI